MLGQNKFLVKVFKRLIKEANANLNLLTQQLAHCSPVIQAFVCDGLIITKRSFLCDFLVA